MARVAAVLRATATAAWRERRSILSFGANNFFLTIVFFFREYMMGAVFYALLASVMLVPLSSDPLHRVPRERLDTWPLSRGQRFALRLLAPWLNPITWLLAAFVIWSTFRRNAQSALLAAGILVGVTLGSALLPRAGRHTLWRLVPRFPSSVRHLLRKDLRQILCTLDFWLAALFSVAFAVARILRPELPAEARTAFSILIVLALSTASQCAFGIDGPAGMTRYRLLPVAGWKVVTSKAAVFLLVSVVLTAPASIVAGLASATAALTFGLFASVRNDFRLPRWRFASSPSARNSIFLVVAVIAVAMGVLRASAWLAAAGVVAALVSVFVNGLRFDRSAAEP